jgi:hypothetical protein
MDHITDQRLVDILNVTAKAAAWDSRPSPHRNARKTGSPSATGRGMSIIVRQKRLLGTYRRNCRRSVYRRAAGDEVHHWRRLRQDQQPEATGPVHEEAK